MRAAHVTARPAAGRAAAPSRFRWRGIDAHGRRRHGAIDAIDAMAARSRLRQRHITVIDIAEAGTPRRRRPRDAHVSRATRQLAGLLDAGLPLLPALQLLAGHAPAPLAHVLASVARDVACGSTLSHALERHPAAFPPVYRKLVALGEKTGSLAAILARVADDRERVAAQRAKVRAALTYPALVLILALGITAALLTWVVPTFEQIFVSFGATLPLPTRIVLALSHGVLEHAPAALTVAGAIATCMALAVRRSARARGRLDAALLRLPLAGALLRQLAIARWSHALGLLLHAGVALADGFDVIAHASGNAIFDAATLDIARRVRRGERLAQAMRAAGCFPEDVIAPIALAEESGMLDTMLADLAALNNRLADERIAAISQLAEPLIIVVLGALVGGLVIAMYLPIIQMGNVI